MCHPLSVFPQENSDAFLLAVDTDWKVGLSSPSWDRGLRAGQPLALPSLVPKEGHSPPSLEQEGLGAWQPPGPPALLTVGLPTPCSVVR